MKIIDKENLMKGFLTGSMPEDKDIKEISIDKLNSFHTGEYKHVFSVNEDEDMLSLIEDIKVNDVVEPILVRPDVDNEYEIIAGHRRVYASRKIGKDAIKAIILDYDDDLAIKTMILTNLEKRSIIKPSEKAFAYKAYMDANKRQGHRTDLNGGKYKNTNKELEEKVHEKRDKIYRTIRITKLIPRLRDMVDEKKIPLAAGVSLSYVPMEIQEKIFKVSNSSNINITTEISNELKTLYEKGYLNNLNDIEKVFQQKKENPQNKKANNGSEYIIIKFLNDVLPDRMQNKTYMEKFMYIRKAIEYRVNQGIIG